MILSAKYKGNHLVSVELSLWETIGAMIMLKANSKRYVTSVSTDDGGWSCQVQLGQEIKLCRKLSSEGKEHQD